MRWLAALVSLVLLGCATAGNECAETYERHLQEIYKQGGLAEVCPPDKEFAIAHFDGPPFAASACLPASYPLAMPHCASSGAASLGESDAAICRAVNAFPDHVALLGPSPRVDASHPAGEWRVRLATPEHNDRQRGILIILPDDASIIPRALLY